MKIKHRLFYALLSGILLSLPWYDSFSGVFLWVAFIPLLLIEDYYHTSYKKTKKEVFLYASLTFLTWNSLTTWWIANASTLGCLTAVLVNTCLFSLIFWLYHCIHKVVGNIAGWLSLIVFWTAFEYFYLNAEISWPWLNLGNGFAHDIKLIQWYEYTGTLGGTVWVLLINVTIFVLLTRGLRKLKLYSVAFLLGILILIPVIFSLARYESFQERKNPFRIAVIQPNVDPYAKLNAKYLCGNLLHIADSMGSSSFDYILAPETAIEDEIWENSPMLNYAIPEHKHFLKRFPKTSFVFGATTLKEYPATATITSTAQPFKKSAGYYDCFNTAMQIDSSPMIQLYHKSKLVVGVEKMPYPKALKWLEKSIIRFGGSFSSYGTQTTRGVFESAAQNVKIAPVICFESAYGEFVTGYINNGAGLIFILTNDAWWGNTPGHCQLLNYARIRAIETRRSIARSANTGISAFINQRGEITSSLGWGIKGGIVGVLNANNYKTFYVRHGDFLGFIALFISVIILLIFSWDILFIKKFCQIF